MTNLRTLIGRSTLMMAGLVAIAGVDSISRPAMALQFYEQTNLVTDNQTTLVNSGYTPAANVDSSLVNPWGVAFSSSGPFWVSDTGTGLSTIYDSAGVKQQLVVTIPSTGGTTSTPTGQVYNSSSNFVISDNGKSGASSFIFATEDGTIAGWNPTVDLNNAVVTVDRSSSGAIYKGLAISSDESSLYAANFSGGTIDKFDSNFNLVSSFSDPTIPSGYAPFNVQTIGDKLYVTYAKQDANKEDDVAGAGNGFLDVFDTDGNLIERAVSNGSLNSPWGIAQAPSNFGEFSNDLLVGNFGDGTINAFDPNTYDYLGQLTDSQGNPITIDGLWALTFGNGGNAGSTNELFFTAGINDEQNGLFGKLTTSVPEPSTMSMLSLGLISTIAFKLRRQKI